MQNTIIDCVDASNVPSDANTRQSKIYDQHAAAFAKVSAWVVLMGGERVATVAIKFPRDGAGRLYAYVHWLGDAMVRGLAAGYGYDKRSAAIENATARMTRPGVTYMDSPDAKAFRAALTNVGGKDWTRALEDAGFTVLQAV